jgi:hypothetical protein
MAEAFTAAIAAWQLFYSLTGSAAFTLAGLVFVAVSINIGMFALAGEQGDLAQFARQTLGNFLALMLISLIFLIPAQGPYGIGIPLLFIGVIMMWRVAMLWKRFEFGRKERRFLDTSLFRFELLIPHTVCYAMLIFISVELLYGNTDYLYGMTLVVLWLLYYGSLCSWFLMLRLAKLAQEHKAGG